MLHMNEALLGGAPYVSLQSFKPFDVAISEGSHVAVVISFKATFSIPRHRRCEGQDGRRARFWSSVNFAPGKSVRLNLMKLECLPGKHYG